MCTRKSYVVCIGEYAEYKEEGDSKKVFICKKRKGAYVRRSFSANSLDSKIVRLSLPRCRRSYTG